MMSTQGKGRAHRSKPKIQVLLVLVAMFAVFLPFTQHASASEVSTPMSEVLSAIRGGDVRSDGLSGAGIDVAVIDTGVQPVVGLDAPNKILLGPDLSFEAGVPGLHGQDTYGHGTVMASIIAGDDAAGGFQGVAPGARILSVKVGDNRGAVDVSQVIAAIDWVVQYGQKDGLNVRVINLAYGTDSNQPYEIDPLAAAVERAWDAGYVVVAAAGNDGQNTAQLTNPAVDPFIIAVAAAEGNGVADFSNPGTTRIPDLMAPGHQILGLAVPGSTLTQDHPEAVIDGRFLRGSGTSHASAVVAGAAAVLLEQRPELTPDQVKALLVAGAMHNDGNSNGNAYGRTRSIQDFVAADNGDRAVSMMTNLAGDVDGLVGSWSDETARGGTRFDTRAGAGMLNLRRSLRLPTLDVTQDFPRSDGSGSLEASRGSHHVMMPDGTFLSGEVTFTGASWSGASWSGASWSGASWSGASWSGASWSGASWSGASWSGASWSGASWSGASWSGASWSGASWSGASWSGASWSGASWSGASWSGASWSGASWSGASWSGASWSGASWSGASWSGASWS